MKDIFRAISFSSQHCLGNLPHSDMEKKTRTGCAMPQDLNSCARLCSWDSQKKIQRRHRNLKESQLSSQLSFVENDKQHDNKEILGKLMFDDAVLRSQKSYIYDSLSKTLTRVSLRAADGKPEWSIREKGNTLGNSLPEIHKHACFHCPKSEEEDGSQSRAGSLSTVELVIPELEGNVSQTTALIVPRGYPESPVVESNSNLHIENSKIQQSTVFNGCEKSESCEPTEILESKSIGHNCVPQPDEVGNCCEDAKASKVDCPILKALVPDPVLLVSKSLDNENPKVGVSEWNLANIGNPPESRDLSSVEKKAVEVLNQEEEKTENSSDSIDNGQINVAMENEGENNERLSDEDSEELEMRQAMEQVEKIIQSTSDLGTDSKVSRSLNFEEVDLFSPKSSNATSCESIQDKEIIPFENVSEEEKETEAFSEDDFRRKSRNTKFLPKKRKKDQMEGTKVEKEAFKLEKIRATNTKLPFVPTRKRETGVKTSSVKGNDLVQDASNFQNFSTFSITRTQRILLSKNAELSPLNQDNGLKFTPQPSSHPLPKLPLRRPYNFAKKQNSLRKKKSSFLSEISISPEKPSSVKSSNLAQSSSPISSQKKLRGILKLSNKESHYQCHCKECRVNAKKVDLAVEHSVTQLVLADKAIKELSLDLEVVRNLLENGLRQQKEKQDLVLDVENVEEALRISYGRKKQVEEQSRALAKNSFQFCKQNVSDRKINFADETGNELCEVKEFFRNSPVMDCRK